MGSYPNHTTSISDQPTAYSVAVVGGGIGGLCLAIGLLKHKHIDLQVYEAAPSFGEIGAGITVGPNAQRALQLISPDAKAVFDRLATPNLWASHANNYTENRCAFGPRAGEIIYTQKNQTGMQCVHRAKLLDGLVQLVPNKRCHFNKRLVRIEPGKEGEECTIYFKDGTTAKAHAVIGADGIHSKVRHHILGETHPAANCQFTGTGTYRSIIEMDHAVEVLGPEMAQNSLMLCGPGRAILSYPIDHGELLNVVIMHYELGDTWDRGNDWIRPSSGEEVRRQFENWDETAQKMAGLVSESEPGLWALFDHPAAPYYNKGSVAMMGDAAHATTPFQGQGAAMAIEDALVLETVLSHVHDASHIANAFAAYNQVRLPRSQRVVTTSRESGELLGMSAPGVGDNLERMAEKLATRMHWIWNRDLVAQNKAAVALYEESL